MSKHTKETGNIHILNTTFKWEIENFHGHFRNEIDFLNSPFFQINNLEWYLTMYPNGNKKKNENQACIFLTLNRTLSTDVSAKFTISVVNGHNLSFSRTASKLFSSKMQSWGFAQFIALDTLLKKGCSIDKKLSILCEIKVMNDVLNEKKLTKVSSKRNDCDLISSLPIDPPRASNKFLNNFEHFFKNQYLSDVIFIVEDRKLQAHKIILSSQSIVLARMFEHSSNSALPSIIEVKDLDYETLEETFKYIYTGKVTNIDRTAGKLIAAAVKYSLWDLQHLCEKSLLNSLTLTNVVENLRIASEHTLFSLRARVVSLLLENAEMVINNGQDYKNIMKIDPDLAVVICRTLTSSSAVKKFKH